MVESLAILSWLKCIDYGWMYKMEEDMSLHIMWYYGGPFFSIYEHAINSGCDYVYAG
jgi:hypothetical protein